MKIVGIIWLQLVGLIAAAQINPEHITIARDSFGVPHIFAKTDAEAAYGLAWAHSEDDFKSIQQNLLAAKGMLGEVEGKNGVLFDFAMKFFGIDTFVENNFDNDLSTDFKKVMNGYIEGVNDYAASHPDEVLQKKALPFTVKDAVKGYTLNLTLMSGAGLALKAIKENRIRDFYEPNETGSNAMAIAPQKTEDGKAWLLVNSHQPIEGPFSWYEAHICSEEGWDIIGGLFPGGATIFVGTNRYLGWAHTNNYHTTGDIYKLKVKGNKYLFDGVWKNFRIGKVKLKVKLGGIKLALSKKLRFSEQGPVFKTKQGYFALRFPANRDMRAAEQWYRMNKAKNLQEFQQAIHLEAIPLFNIIYADREGNIFWQSGGMFPIRPIPQLSHQPLDGTRSDVVWHQLLPYEKKPALLNPDCGYVFNCNETPLNTSGESCNWKGNFSGCQRFQYNRGERFGEMLKAIPGKLTWSDFNRIKFDKHYCLDSSYAQKFHCVYSLDETKYPQIADCILKLKHWNFDGSANNREAPVAMLMHEYLIKKYKWPFAMFMIRQQPVSEKEAVWAIGQAKKFLLKTHQSTDLALGDLQRHIRGHVNLPASGLKEVPRAADCKLWDKKKGIYRVTGGDGYIQMNRYSTDGVEVNSINAYGASTHSESKHYTDQMEMFENQQFKRMTFDKDEILQHAERIYHPAEEEKTTGKAQVQ